MIFAAVALVVGLGLCALLYYLSVISTPPPSRGAWSGAVKVTAKLTATGIHTGQDIRDHLWSKSSTLADALAKSFVKDMGDTPDDQIPWSARNIFVEWITEPEEGDDFVTMTFYAVHNDTTILASLKGNTDTFKSELNGKLEASMFPFGEDPWFSVVEDPDVTLTDGETKSLVVYESVAVYIKLESPPCPDGPPEGCGDSAEDGEDVEGACETCFNLEYQKHQQYISDLFLVGIRKRADTYVNSNLARDINVWCEQIGGPASSWILCQASEGGGENLSSNVIGEVARNKEIFALKWNSVIDALDNLNQFSQIKIARKETAERRRLESGEAPAGEPLVHACIRDFNSGLVCVESENLEKEEFNVEDQYPKVGIGGLPGFSLEDAPLTISKENTRECGWTSKPLYAHRYEDATAETCCVPAYDSEDYLSGTLCYRKEARRTSDPLPHGLVSFFQKAHGEGRCQVAFGEDHGECSEHKTEADCDAYKNADGRDGKCWWSTFNAVPLTPVRDRDPSGNAWGSIKWYHACENPEGEKEYGWDLFNSEETSEPESAESCPTANAPMTCAPGVLFDGKDSPPWEERPKPNSPTGSAEEAGDSAARRLLAVLEDSAPNVKDSG